jgi:hypothetical protein
MTNTLAHTVSHEAQSQLAKLLAMENITVQHQASAKTAMFDVKNRVLILPVWREMSKPLYDMLVIHEVGHALDTPMFLDDIEAISKKLNARVAVVKDFFNVIEDARIDKRQKRRYPGSRRDYIKGYAELIEKDFFGTASRDVNSMTFIDRINIYFKGGALSGIRFSNEEKAFISRIENAETVEEVYTLVEDVYNFSKTSQSENQEEPGDADADVEIEIDFDEDFEGNFSSGSDTDEDEEAYSSNGASDEEADDDEDSDEDASPDAFGDTDGDINAGSSKESYVDEVESPETEKAWQKKQEELLANSNINYVYVTIPRPSNINDIVDDYKIVHKQMSSSLAACAGSAWLMSVREELNAFRVSENATISYMVKEFEMRKSADEYRRTATGKTGAIDMNKLHSYKYNDDLFRRITTVSEGKNHGFVMFVDWSGSMEHHLKNTLKQMFSLVWFCKRVQIPFEVYSFRSINQSDNFNKNFCVYKKTDLDLRPFKLRNILSSRMNSAEMNTAFFNLWSFACGAHIRTDSLGSTPLNDAIMVADLVVNAFKNRTKVQVVNTVFLTDGESDGCSLHNQPHFSPKTSKFILQDEITKKDFNLGSSYGGSFYSTKETTATLLRVLKERTNCNLIGFYVYGEGFRTMMHSFYGYNYDDKFAKEAKKSFEELGFVTVTNSGYDEYYILRAGSLNIKTNNLVIDKGMSKAKIAKAFLSFAEKKSVNRVLLQRFIKKIAA